MNIYNTKLITLEAKDLSGGLSSSKLVLKFLPLESLVLAHKINTVDVKRLVRLTVFCETKRNENL